MYLRQGCWWCLCVYHIYIRFWFLSFRVVVVVVVARVEENPTWRSNRRSVAVATTTTAAGTGAAVLLLPRGHRLPTRAAALPLLLFSPLLMMIDPAASSVAPLFKPWGCRWSLLEKSLSSWAASNREQVKSEKYTRRCVTEIDRKEAKYQWIFFFPNWQILYVYWCRYMRKISGKIIPTNKDSGIQESALETKTSENIIRSLSEATNRPTNKRDTIIIMTIIIIIIITQIRRMHSYLQLLRLLLCCVWCSSVVCQFGYGWLLEGGGGGGNRAGGTEWSKHTTKWQTEKEELEEPVLLRGTRIVVLMLRF